MNGDLRDVWLTFDDVLIHPAYSVVDSRMETDLGVLLANGPFISTPVMSANMPSVTGWRMAQAMCESGGIGILPRRLGDEEDSGLSPERYSKEVRSLGMDAGPHGMSIGLTETEDQIRLIAKDAKIISVELARADSSIGRRRVVQVRELVGPDVCLMVGNIVTMDASRYLVEAGADILKIGVGAGAVCTTRLVSGVGVPQLTAVNEIHRNLLRCGLRNKVSLCSDGGILHPGDVAKAIVAGADCVMIGRLLASCQEAENDGIYKGSSTYTTSRTHEGVEVEIRKERTVAQVMSDIEGGLRSAMSYCNARSLAELREKGRLIRISRASMIEGGVRE